MGQHTTSCGLFYALIDTIDKRVSSTMLISPKLLVDAVGCTPERAAEFAPHIAETCERFDINTPGRQAMFLAQVGHESGSFRWVAELWGPTPAQLRYEGRADLGNTQPGDGSRYRGHGLIQTTGRANHRELRPGLLLAGYDDVPDFEAEPERLTEPRWAAASAGFFWSSRKLNALADAGQFDAITKRVNGGANGAADRRLRWSKALSAINVHAKADNRPANATEVPAVADTEIVSEIVPPIVSPGGYMSAGEFIPETTPMDPVTGGFLVGLAKDLIGAFTPLAKAKAQKELSRHTDPQMAEQIAGNFIEAAVAATGRAGAVDAVSEAKRDPEVLAKVESDSMASLEKVLPLMERLNAMDQQNIAAARKYNSDEPMMIDTKWVRMKFIHVLSLLFISFSAWFVTMNWASLTPELRGAVITLMVIAGWNGVRDYWMSSSSGSDRKTSIALQK